MTYTQKRVLTALVAFGPCSNKRIADALGWPPAEVYKIVYRLRRLGYAKAGGGYDITPEGRKLFATVDEAGNRQKDLFEVAGERADG